MEQAGKTVVFADLTGSTGLFESAGNVVATHVVTRCTQALGAHFARAGGRIVKFLGDGVLATFDDTVAAVEACTRTRDILHDLNTEQFRHAPLAFKIGVAHGAIIEQDGDCYGDTVNVAARLSDRAEAGEILVSESVFNRLPELQRLSCSSLDRIMVKGKAEPLRVWRIDWARTAETTLTIPLDMLDGRGRLAAGQRLHLDLLDQHLQLLSSDGPLVIGRGDEVGFSINDPRVSRRHARIEWTAGQCVLTDFSSNGTWVSFKGAASPVMLKRDSCMLHGSGEIGLGAAPGDFTAPTLTFQVIDDA
ncbi:MAG: adenylate/guanylate cyclase domain-containing protein [Parazoarcus communis]